MHARDCPAYLAAVAALYRQLHRLRELDPGPPAPARVDPWQAGYDAGRGDARADYETGLRAARVGHAAELRATRVGHAAELRAAAAGHGVVGGRTGARFVPEPVVLALASAWVAQRGAT